MASILESDLEKLFKKRNSLSQFDILYNFLMLDKKKTSSTTYILFHLPNFYTKFENGVAWPYVIKSCPVFRFQSSTKTSFAVDKLLSTLQPLSHSDFPSLA